MQQYKTFSLFIVLALTLLFGVALYGPTDIWLEKHAVRAAVEKFGAQLNKVPLAAEEWQIRDALVAHYRPYLTEELLQMWSADPSRAAGRQTSSPWPARIEVNTVHEQGETYVVNGEIVLMTSVEEASAADDDAGRIPVVLLLMETDAGWRIAAYQEQVRETPSP